MTTFLIIIGVVFVLALVINLTKQSKSKSKVLGMYKSLSGFNESKMYMAPWRHSIIAVDEVNSELVVIEQDYIDSIQEAVNKKNIGKHVVNRVKFENIIGFDVVQNDNVKSEKSSVIGRSIVGGLLAGGVGAIIGGVTAGSKEKMLVKSLDVVINVESISSPTVTFRFFDAWEDSLNTKKQMDSSDSVYRSALNSSKEWAAVLNVIISRNKKAHGVA